MSTATSSLNSGPTEAGSAVRFRGPTSSCCTIPGHAAGWRGSPRSLTSGWETRWPSSPPRRERRENPAWFHNLLAYPETVVEVGTRTVRVRARLAQPAERDVIYSRQKQRHPAFAQYEAKAAPRKIPVVVLDPVK